MRERAAVETDRERRPTWKGTKIRSHSVRPTEQRPCYCIRCTALVLLDVVGSGCGALRCRIMTQNSLCSHIANL